MRRVHRKTFEELLLENKEMLLKDKEALHEIEKRIEARHEIKRVE